MAKEQEQERQGQLVLDFDCTAYEITGRSYSPTSIGDGCLFSCSIGPLPDDTIATLAKAAGAHAPIRLLFGGDLPVLLELATLERKAAQRVRLFGFVAHAPKVIA
jgi:hypothetical protein